MTVSSFFGVVKRRILAVLVVIAACLCLLYTFRNAVPNSFAGVSHVVLVADSGARDPSVGIVDLPSIATSTVVLQRVRENLKLPMTLIDLKSNVSAAVLGRSSIMAIGFRDRSAEVAISVSNAVADELSHYYDEISTQRYDVNVSRLTTELNLQAAKMQAVDAQISAVVKANPFVVSDKSVDSITMELATLNDQRANSKAQLAADNALAMTMMPNAQLSKAARHEILADDPAYTAGRLQEGKDSAALSSQQASYTADFPGLPGAMAKVRGEQESLAREAARALADPKAFSPSANASAQQYARERAIIEGDEAHVNQLDGLVAVQQGRLEALPTTGSRYGQLTSQRTAMQTEYAALAMRRANALANRAEASSLGSVVVLDRALKADTQLAGGRSRAAAVGIIFTLTLAIGMAFLVEWLDPRVSRPEDIQQIYGIPVVATFGTKS